MIDSNDSSLYPMFFLIRKTKNKMWAMKIKRQDFEIFEDVEDRSGASFKKYVKPFSAFFNRDFSVG